MAKMSQFTPLYNAFNEFIRKCLLDDQSILWPEINIWTKENLQELRERFIENNVAEPNLSFEEKLTQQLDGGKKILWALIADIYYVYFLPSASLTHKKKLNDIEWAASQAGFSPPPADDPIWKPQDVGFTATGQRYHQKYMQFWLIILFALQIKESDNPRVFFEDSDQMQALLDKILDHFPRTDRAYGMRHAILYLTFPEKYERIISTHDKKMILKNYSPMVNQTLPDDIDQALLIVRDKLNERFKDKEEPFDYYDDLKSEWKMGSTITKPDEGDETGEEIIEIINEKDIDLLRVKAVLEHTRNVILYGPPGTGKTYIAQKVAEAWISPQLEKGLSEAAAIARVIGDLTFYQILALSMYINGPEKNYSVTELGQQNLIKVRFDISPVKYPNRQIWGYLQAHADPNSKTVKVTNRNEPYLFDKDQDSHWRLTNNGRRFVEEELRNSLELLKSINTIELKLDDFIRWVTFHQSYAYEDFVEGLRPTISEDTEENISYEITPGIFREICTLAGQDPDNNYVLIIDEINRGNIAKILGELITLLEDDKRGKLNITLPYSKESFTVPKNLYIIATMNTADRSIALMDVALRRRFTFIEIMPRLDLLEDAIVETEGPSVNLGKLLARLNKDITQYLDRNHQIGHSYFLKIAKSDADEPVESLTFIWNYQILPLLEEYFYSQQDKLKSILSPFITSGEAAPGSMENEFVIGRAEGEDLIDALGRLSEK